MSCAEFQSQLSHSDLHGVVLGPAAPPPGSEQLLVMGKRGAERRRARGTCRAPLGHLELCLSATFSKSASPGVVQAAVAQL